MIARSRAYFDSAYEVGVMGVYAAPAEGRRLLWKPCGETSGQEIVDFTRTCYLGLDRHPEVVRGAIEAIERHGAIHWATGRTRLNTDLMGRLEERLSALVRARVITSSTVSMANQGALPLIASGCLTDGVAPVVVFDRECHASLSYHRAALADETEVVTIAHNDMDALEAVCRRSARTAYVADGVYSMGDTAPIPRIRELQERYDLLVYIDDAHGMSIVGERGEGFARSSYPDELGARTIIVASMSKGMGATGGLLMLGTDEQEALFRRYSQSYVYSGAPNLAAIGAAHASAAIHATPEIRELQAALAARLHAFDERVHSVLRGNPFPIRVLRVGDEHETIRLTRRLLDRGFYTMAAFFPSVARGRGVIRICLTATHSFEDVERLGAAIAETVPQRP
jgi:7-keto-8-aminopelargonate synthetase-like enzyme